MKKPVVLLDLSIYLEALLSPGSESARLLRRWLEHDQYQVVSTALGLRAVEGSVLDPEFLAATDLDAESADRWVAALGLRVETVDLDSQPVADLDEGVETCDTTARLSGLDRDTVLAARAIDALVISSDPTLLESEGLGIEVLSPSSLLSVLDAL